MGGPGRKGVARHWLPPLPATLMPSIRVQPLPGVLGQRPRGVSWGLLLPGPVPPLTRLAISLLPKL